MCKLHGVSRLIKGIKIFESMPETKLPSPPTKQLGVSFNAN